MEAQLAKALQTGGFFQVGEHTENGITTTRYQNDRRIILEVITHPAGRRAYVLTHPGQAAATRVSEPWAVIALLQALCQSIRRPVYATYPVAKRELVNV